MSAPGNLPIPLCGGDEYDALTRGKRFHQFRPGERKGIKRGYQRRARRAANAACIDEAAAVNLADPVNLGA